MSKIKILKDTPFDKKDDVLSIIDFRAKYGWIVTNTTSDKELMIYLKEWQTLPKTQNTINVGEWFQVIDVLTFGGKLVEIYKNATNSIIIRSEEGKMFYYNDVLEWYNHYVNSMTGFGSITESPNQPQVRFEGFIVKRFMFPEKLLIKNKAERNTHGQDDMYFPFGVGDYQDVTIKIGCTVGTLDEIINILNECKRLKEKK